MGVNVDNLTDNEFYVADGFLKKLNQSLSSANTR